MKHLSKSAQPIFDTDKKELIGEVTLDPKQGKELFIGEYERVMSQPRFELKFEPSIEHEVKESLIRVDNEGEYTLTYYFQNFSELPCRVAVLEIR